MGTHRLRPDRDAFVFDDEVQRPVIGRNTGAEMTVVLDVLRMRSSRGTFGPLAGRLSALGAQWVLPRAETDFLDEWLLPAAQ